MNKEIKYIPGDLVMTNGIPIGTKKGSVYQVTESNPDKYRPVEDGNIFTELKGSVTLSNIKGKTVYDEGFLFGDCGTWVKDIVPIPLTPDIFEKNGWTKGEYEPWRKGRIEIEQCNKSEFMYCKGDLKVMFLYVHSLQHFLFGLGLNSEMEV